MNVFLEACGLKRICDHVGQFNVIGAQQLNDLMCMSKCKNVCAWIVQYSAQLKLNAIEVEE